MTDTLIEELREGPAPLPAPTKLCCDGCRHLKTKWWKDCLDNDETDSGTSAQCGAVPDEHGGKSISAYWSAGTGAPDWCPFLADRLSAQAGGGEAVDWRHKLWMIACHATGGGIPEIEGVDRSINDICVQISAHNNAIWKSAQEAALRDAPTYDHGKRDGIEAGAVRLRKLAMPNGDILECEYPNDANWARAWSIRYPDTGQIGTTGEQWDEVVECYGLTAILEAAIRALSGEGREVAEGPTYDQLLEYVASSASAGCATAAGLLKSTEAQQ